MREREKDSEGGGGLERGRVRVAWERLSSGFAFLPALLTVTAILLFFVTQHLDQVFRTNLGSLPVLFSGGPSAARSVLSAVSSSTITVVATVFSLTIVALQLASSSYTPRVLRSFTSDRGAQLVLGVFMATFLYSLLVLRIIRSPEGSTDAFVPKISVTVAIVLTVACVGLLVYFVNHIATIIQSSAIVERAHKDAARTIAGLMDRSLEGEAEEDREDDASPAGEPLVLRARNSGYVQHVDADALAEAVVGAGVGEADGGKVVVEVPFGPGFFVAAGLPVVRVWPARGLGGERVDDTHDALVLGRERSFQQDFAFGLRQLSDIALKGLSPGVNDPTTSMQAMDRMEAIFVALGGKRMPARTTEREVRGATVTVRIGHYGFDDVVGPAFDQIRRSAFTSGQVAVLERLLEILDRAIAANTAPGRRLSLWARAFAAARLAPEQVADPEDASTLALRAVRIGEYLLKAGQGEAVRADLRELAELCEGLRGGQRVREAVDAALGGHVPPDPSREEPWGRRFR